MNYWGKEGLEKEGDGVPGERANVWERNCQGLGLSLEYDTRYFQNYDFREGQRQSVCVCMHVSRRSSLVFRNATLVTTCRTQTYMRFSGYVSLPCGLHVKFILNKLLGNRNPRNLTTCCPIVMNLRMLFNRISWKNSWSFRFLHSYKLIDIIKIEFKKVYSTENV